MSRNPMGIRRKFRAPAAALAVAMAFAAAAPGAAAVPGKFWGVVPQATPTAEQFQRLKRGGVDSMRVPVAWNGVQPVRGGALDWSGVDAVIGGATAAGIEVLPFLSGAPTWAVPQDKRFFSPVTLPVRTALQKSGWKNFVRQAVLRYGPNGSFWAENPAVPKRPVRTWQIWNEANFLYFVARPNPAEYGQLVKLSSAAVKGADRGAKVILGGLFSHPVQAVQNHKPPQAYFAGDFLEQMYKKTPGIKTKFDGVAVHPYTSRYQRLTPYIEEVRKAMKDNGDAATPLWVTELSWSSQPPAGNNFGKGLSGQAQQLRGAFGLIERNQAKWKIQRVYWFSVDDQAGTCNFCDGSGLFGAGFVPKPSWKAFVAFAGGKP